MVGQIGTMGRVFSPTPWTPRNPGAAMIRAGGLRHHYNQHAQLGVAQAMASRPEYGFPAAFMGSPQYLEPAAARSRINIRNPGTLTAKIYTPISERPGFDRAMSGLPEGRAKDLIYGPRRFDWSGIKTGWESGGYIPSGIKPSGRGSRKVASRAMGRARTRGAGGRYARPSSFGFARKAGLGLAAYGAYQMFQSEGDTGYGKVGLGLATAVYGGRAMKGISSWWSKGLKGIKV